MRQDGEDALSTKQEKTGLSHSLKDLGRHKGHFLVSDNGDSLICPSKARYRICTPIILVKIGEILTEGRWFAFLSDFTARR